MLSSSILHVETREVTVEGEEFDVVEIGGGDAPLAVPLDRQPNRGSEDEEGAREAEASQRGVLSPRRPGANVSSDAADAADARPAKRPRAAAEAGTAARVAAGHAGGRDDVDADPDVVDDGEEGQSGSGSDDDDDAGPRAAGPRAAPRPAPPPVARLSQVTFRRYKALCLSLLSDHESKHAAALDAARRAVDAAEAAAGDGADAARRDAAEQLRAAEAASPGLPQRDVQAWFADHLVDRASVTSRAGLLEALRHLRAVVRHMVVREGTLDVLWQPDRREGEDETDWRRRCIGERILGLGSNYTVDD